MGGRICHADVPENAKHQVILAKDHPLSLLVIQNIHKENFHVGREHTLALLRQHYWIPACRGLIRRILHNCLRCKRDRVLPKPTFMGDLPKERLSIGKTPFNNTGVHYFGLYYVKKSKMTRTTKGVKKCNGVLFTCLMTSTIRVELAGDLSTDEFLLALQRFISRRGTLEIIQSDNGTNFAGTNSKMKTCLKELDQVKIKKLYVWQKHKMDFQPIRKSLDGWCVGVFFKVSKENFESYCLR